MQKSSEIEIANEKENLLPTITLTWDAATQMVDTQFDSNQFRTWQFVQHVLQMAMENAKRIDDFANAARMQAMAEEQMRTQRMASKLHRG